MRLSTLVVALVIVSSYGCGSVSISTATPSPRCPAQEDSVDVRHSVVLIANSSAQPTSCQGVQPGTEIQETSGGIATATFKTDATCNFYQLLAATVGSQSKTVHVFTRDPVGSIFHMSDGELDCTLQSGSAIGPLCGQVTVNATTGPSGVYVSCNSDPVAVVAVYRGSVSVSLKVGPSTKVFPLGTGQSLSADLFSGKVTQLTAQFTKEQIALFDAQLDALSSGVPLSDGSSLLQVNSLSPSDNVVAPNAIETYIGKQNYGQVKPMCSAVSAPIVFYPASPLASTPVLYGGLCAGKSARVYGIAIYQPNKLTYGGQFYSESGGTLVKVVKFDSPATLEFEASTQLFTWKGDLGRVSPSAGLAPTPGRASKAVYVAKFIYDLPPDTTPRIGLVAISYGGAAFPPIIS